MPLAATIRNVARNSLRRSNFAVMAEKLILRLRDRRNVAERDAVAQWCTRHAQPWEDLAKQLDPALWEETQQACARMKAKADAKLAALGLDLGGGGHYPLLYFMTRRLRPRAIVETGVAAGWSSQAMLTALRANGNGGHLYSSDFPYFRYQDPERYVGFVVDEDLKRDWTLLIDGDRQNLPRIARQVESIDLFHYDSDKSYAGRDFAMRALAPKLSARAAILFDDVQDNFHFRDLAASRGWRFRLFAFEGKYAGLTGPAA